MLVSERPGEMTELAAQAAQEYELLVVVGGDGTVNEVVNGIAGVVGPELAVVPRGTGRDFARTFGIGARFDDAIRTRSRDASARSTRGRVAYRAVERRGAASWFANVASAGMSGAIARRANDSSKALGGRSPTSPRSLPSSRAGT